jgi:hypothetical protein
MKSVKLVASRSIFLVCLLAGCHHEIAAPLQTYVCGLRVHAKLDLLESRRPVMTCEVYNVGRDPVLVSPLLGYSWLKVPRDDGDVGAGAGESLPGGGALRTYVLLRPIHPLEQLNERQKHGRLLELRIPLVNGGEPLTDPNHNDHFVIHISARTLDLRTFQDRVEELQTTVPNDE